MQANEIKLASVEATTYGWRLDAICWLPAAGAIPRHSNDSYTKRFQWSSPSLNGVRSAVSLPHLVPPAIGILNRYQVAVVTNGAVHNRLAVHSNARRKAVATRAQFSLIDGLSRPELPQCL